MTTTSGNLIVAANSWCCSPDTIATTDSNFNGWTRAVSSPTGNFNATQDYAKSITGGAGHTFTTTGTGTMFAWLVAIEISGANTTSPLDQIQSTNDTGTSHSTGNTPTTTVANEILIGVGSNTNTGVFTTDVGADWAEISNHSCCPSPFEGVVVGRKNVTSTGAYSYTFTTDTNITTGQAIATWKEATASGTRQRCIGCGTDKKVIGDR